MDHIQPKSRFVKWSLIIGIVIVLNLFFNYALYLVYPSPQYNTFCPVSQIVTVPQTQQQCLNVGGKWTQTATPQNEFPPTGKDAALKTLQPQVSGYCDSTYTCQNKFDTVNKVYERNVFIILIILGVISLFIGIFFRVGEVVSIALSFGGVLSLIIASGRYWSEAQNVLKVAILAIALIALIWVGIKKFK